MAPDSENIHEISENMLFFIGFFKKKLEQDQINVLFFSIDRGRVVLPLTMLMTVSEGSYASQKENQQKSYHKT
jgi:hypothetical protein